MCVAQIWKQVVILVPFAYTAAAPIASLVRERASGSKQIQFVCGARVTSYWAAVWLWDALTLCGVVALMMAALSTMTSFTGTLERWAASLLLLLLYGLNTMFLASLASYTFTACTHSRDRSACRCCCFCSDWPTRSPALPSCRWLTAPLPPLLTVSQPRYHRC